MVSFPDEAWIAPVFKYVSGFIDTPIVVTGSIQ
jgi:hypothetical protein